MNHPTVYLIDDEPAQIELLTDVVELVGLDVRGFTRANRFFEKIEVFEAGSIVVLDLHMPEMDGVEVMRRLAELQESPALILISGQDAGVLHAAEKLGRAKNLQILASLSKPVPIDRFQQLLEKYALGSVGGRSSGPLKVQRERTHSEARQTIGGGRRIQHFPPQIHIAEAIRDDQLILHYQPQFDVATSELIGVEALVRWQHPEQGLIYPDRFIPQIEQKDLMAALTHWVINNSVHQQQQWRDDELQVSVSVNVSAIDITTLVLPDLLTVLLANNKLDPTRLTLEVTESALMGELATSLDVLTRLRLKGIRLSIDDFGTGYSSLSLLHRVPFTELKIDRSFVSNMTDDDEAHAIVKTCIILGHELKMLVVAEGVETEAQLEELRQLECDRAQGYFFSKPLPVEKMTDLLKKQSQSVE